MNRQRIPGVIIKYSAEEFKQMACKILLDAGAFSARHVADKFLISMELANILVKETSDMRRAIYEENMRHKKEIKEKWQEE